MDIEVVERAVAQLVSQGLPLAAISAPKVREILGAGSYRDITKYLRTIKASAGVVVGDEPSEGEDPDDEEPSSAPEPHDEAPPALADPIAEAEQALAEAQQALQGKMDALPEAERELADSRGRVLEALAAQLAAIEGCRRGIFANDDPVRTMTAAEVADAVAHFQQARQHWRYALDGVDGFGQRVREAQASLTAVRRQHFLAQHHPALVQALQDALEAQARDPWLQPMADPRALQAVQHRYRHQYALEDIRRRLEAACREAGL
jgi:tetratricopeptide (TPR) repeat protein